MAYAPAKDGTRLYYEETGSGTPVIFVHEFAGDYRSWETQMRFFGALLPLHHLQRARLPALRRPGGRREIFAGACARRHHRGARPPEDRRARISSACRWAASPCCMSASRYPQRARSLVIAGCGYGAEPDKKDKFQAECEAAAASFESRLGRRGEEIRARPDARAVAEQGPARLGRIRRSSSASIRPAARRSPCAACR